MRVEIIILIFFIIKSTVGFNILICIPLYSGSHILTLNWLAEGLAARDHQVHILRWKDDHTYPPTIHSNISFTELSIDNSEGIFRYLSKEKEGKFQLPLDVLWESRPSSPFSFLANIVFDIFPLFGTQFTQTLLSNDDLIKELKIKKFDIAIADLVLNEASLVLINHLEIPTVGYWRYPLSFGEADLTTAFLPPSHVPSLLARLPDRMDFWERTFNSILKVLGLIIMKVQCGCVYDVSSKLLPESPHPADLIGNLSGLLINSDPILDYPRLLPPTFINVGGLQPPGGIAPLDSDIQTFLDGAEKHGAILFSLGLVFKAEKVPIRIVRAFLQAFAKLPQRVIFKFEAKKNSLKISKNVKLVNWVSQAAVLAHPNTRLFITHCGLKGVLESVRASVPMVGMPIFLDQADVCRKLETRGIALILNKENLMADDVLTNVNSVLGNASFKENVNKLSQLMQDTKETPEERAIWLIEFLARNKGAEHLRLASRHLSIIQYFSLDSIAFALALFLLPVYALFQMCKKIVNSITSTYQNTRLFII